MSRRTFPALVALGMFAVTAAAALSDEKAAAEPEMSPEQAAMTKAWQATMSPSDWHLKLQPLVGTFDSTNTMWMSPGAPPVTSAGRSESRWLLGGRFVEQVYTGTFMDGPFEGRGLTGYDNVLKKYIGVWIDSWGTGFMTASGQVDESGRVFTFHAEYPNPMTGEPLKFREILTVESPNRHSFVMYGPDHETGAEFKHMEIVYTRVGAAPTN